jgi:retron-type reverse transcriptase
MGKHGDSTERSWRAILQTFRHGCGAGLIERSRYVDISSFFDGLNHKWLIKFVEQRVADQRVV